MPVDGARSTADDDALYIMDPSNGSKIPFVASKQTSTGEFNVHLARLDK